MARRSVLFTPGDRPEMLRGALDTDADAVVFDLEDGVAPDRTAEARATVVDVLEGLDGSPDPELFVRVNPVRFRGPGEPEIDDPTTRTDVPMARTDVQALGHLGDVLDGVCLPKVGGVRAIRRVAALLRRHGLPRSVLALAETAAGVQAAPAIAAAGATTALAFGAEDYAADVGASRSAEGTEVSYARQRVVTAASAAGIDAVDTLWTDYEDVEGLRTDARRAVALGYDGKLVIHPDQIQAVNEAFVPDPEERAWARDVLAARDAADDAGRGAFAVDGEMIDAPLVARAEGIADRARAAGIDLESAAEPDDS